jgi:hypothetical protein
MAFEGLHFDVGMNAADFNQGVKQMKGQVQTFDDSLKKVGRTIAGVFAGVSVVATLKKSIELWGKQETAVKKLSIAANRFTRDSTKTVSTVQKLASELQHLTGMGDEAIISVAALGLNLGIAEEKIGKATEAAALLAQVTDMSLESAMKNMAKTQAGLTGELGEMLPFLRELTTEELKNGAAIDMIIEKYAGFAEQLSQTSEVGMKRFWSALGDIGEKLGQSFTPMILKAADAMENLSSKIQKPTDILKVMKDMVVSLYESMGTLGKVLFTLTGAFIGLKVAGLAWKLLSSIVVTGSKLIIAAFKTIFSWPFLLISGLYLLRVAWEKDWFGMKTFALDSWEQIKTGWSDAYDTFRDVWSDDSLTFWDKLMVSVGKVAKDTISGLKDGWTGAYESFTEIWNSDNISFWEKLMATISKGAKDVFDGIKEGWSGTYENFKDVWSDPNLSWWEKLWSSIGLTANRLWEGTEEYKGMKDIFIDSWNEFIGIWKDPDLSFWDKLWNSLLLLPEKLLEAIQSIGAAFTDLLGGDTQRYLETTNTALESINNKIAAIGEQESVSKKVAVGFDVAEEIYKLPAKFVLSGFVDNFDQAWIDNALNMLAVVGVTRFLGGSWRLAVGLALGADLIFGDDVSENELINKLKKELEVVGITWLAAGAKWALTVGVVIGGVEFGSWAGKNIGTWLKDIGWEDWAKETLGEDFFNTMMGDFEEQINYFTGEIEKPSIFKQLEGAGRALAVTLMAGFKWAFWDMPINIFELVVGSITESEWYQSGIDFANDIIQGFKDAFIAGLNFAKWLGEKVTNIWEEIKAVGISIGEAILEGIKTVFGFGWLLELIQRGGQPEPTSGGGGAFQHGGYTSEVGTSTPAGIVHGGEWVAPAWMVDKYPQLLSLLESIRNRGYQSGGLVDSNNINGLKNVIQGYQSGGLVSGISESVGGQAVVNINIEKSWLEQALDDVFEVLQSDVSSGFEMIWSFLNKAADKFGFKMPEGLDQKMNDLTNQMDNLTQSTYKGGSALFRLTEAAHTLGWDKLKLVNERIAILEQNIDDATSAYINGEITLKEFRNAVDESKDKLEQANSVLEKLTETQTTLLDKLKKNITEQVAGGSELFSMDKLTDTTSTLADAFVGASGIVTQFATGLLSSIMNVEAINKLLNPISTIISGMMVILEPMLNLLMPIADLLSSIGTWMATLLTVFQPMIKIFSRGAAILSWFFDQWTLLVDKLFRWLDSIPGVGRFFDPILSEEERQKKQMTIEERLEQYDIPQSTANTTFSAGSTQEITNNYYFEFKDNQILTEDDESVRRFADAIYQNLRDRGVEFEVG